MEESRRKKAELRKNIIRMRDALGEEKRKQASEIIVDQVANFTQFKDAKLIFAFIPFGSEVDIKPLIEESWNKGKQVVVPRVEQKEKKILLYELRGWNDLGRGHYGIMEPNQSCPPFMDYEKIDLIFMPGVAFDERKGRLGYGAGYYDRFLHGLKHHPYLLAPTFEIQVVSEMPVNSWDVPVDGIVTEERWIL